MAFQLPQYAVIPDRQIASSSPAPSLHRRHAEDLPRPMNLRILYTFDLKAENSCLAKLQHVFPIQTVALADGTQLGITNLKTCLQAILKASPEIYSEETDYTVYAYDPSEQGTPRVGHGRLSQIIQTNDFSEEEQITVTGVVKNNLAVLATSHHVQDNLEIRLSLTPVQNRGRAESGSRSPYLQETVPSPRLSSFPEPSNLINLSNLDPQLLMLLQNATNSQSSNQSMDAFQRFMSNSSSNTQNSRPTTSSNFSGFAPQYQGSRPASPALSVASNASTGGRRVFKRTASNVSKSNAPDLSSSLNQVNSGYASGEEISMPKRARVVQTNRPGKNVLSKKGDLRMAASTSASMRVYQPTAIRPNERASQSLEEPPRIPTPVPQGNRGLQRRVSSARSSLGLHAENSFSQESLSPYSDVNLPSLPNSAVTSPEGIFGPAVTPEELGSSPPVIPGLDGCPSSPALPPLHTDSGFMSGGYNDMSEIENEDLDGQSHEAVSMPPPQKKVPYKVDFKSTQVLQNSTPNIRPPTPLSAGKARNAASVKKPTPPPSSDILPASEGVKRPRGRPSKEIDDGKTSWDKERRRQAMEAKLRKSVANGEIPPFCHNCGVIETPTWRRVWTKIHSGDPPEMEIPRGGVKEDGAIIGFEIVQRHPETGKNELFRIYKKNLLPSDEGFEATSLCNPCGLWIKNRGRNRPEKLWNKNNDAEDARDQNAPERTKRPRLAKGGDEEGRSDSHGFLNMYSESDAYVPALKHQSSTMSEPIVPATVDSIEAQTTTTQDGEQEEVLIIQDDRSASRDSNTQQNGETTATGNRHSPIELDNEPSPVRRSLFSSPKSSGPLGVDISSTNPATKDKPNSTESDKLTGVAASAELTESHGGKLQVEKTVEGSSTFPPVTPTKKKKLHLPPVTPSQNSASKDSSFSRSPSNLFKTPSRASGAGTPNNHRVTTSDFFSSSAKRLLHGASIGMTPSRATQQSPAPGEGRLSPQLPRLLRTIYGSPSPENDDFSDIFDVDMNQLFNDCCPGYSLHKEGCPKRSVMMNHPVFDDGEDFRSDFPGTDDDWAAADAFFNSSGITGFTPRKPLEATDTQEGVDVES